MKLLLKIYSFILFFVTMSSFTIAQTTANQVEMDDVMHANGKIYVVVCVLAVVFLGIIAFLISIDRKVSKLEKKMKEN